ncbi:MAG: tetratricopeptide repeat protein [Parahaliea sp.]
MNLMHRLRTLFLLVWLAVLAGCSVYSVPGSKPAPVEDRTEKSSDETRTTVEPRATPETTSPTYPQQTLPPDPNASNAYGGLLVRAEQAAQGGDYEQALALLERAQRIDPDSAEVYLALAQTYAAKGDNSRARATAERGMLYCRSDSECNKLRQLSVLP